MTHDEQERLARDFFSLLGRPNAALAESLATADVVWSFPGASRISGEARGVAEVIARARIVASYGVKVEVIRAVFGLSGLAMLLHNTGEKSGQKLDEYLAAVFAYRGAKISRLDIYLSDVAATERFFV